MIAFVLCVAGMSCASSHRDIEPMQNGALSPPICRKDSDCVAVMAGCCGCSYGGANVALHKDEVKSYREKIWPTCGDAVCLTEISQHVSCTSPVICQKGDCVFESQK